jgi:hypothetical protein
MKWVQVPGGGSALEVASAEKRAGYVHVDQCASAPDFDVVAMYAQAEISAVGMKIGPESEHHSVRSSM